MNLEPSDAEKVRSLMQRLVEFFDAIEPDLLRYPAIDAACFRDKVRRAVR